MKMKKLLLLSLTSLLLVSCNQTNNQAMQASTVEETHQEETQQDQTPVETSKYAFEVVNQSNFSNEDLIYFIMVDRFYDGDKTNNNFEDYSDNPEDLKSYLGGDLRGVIEKLDYIKSQGATAIWLTPIVKNEPYGYHGYWTADFESVDPHFGDLDTLKELVDKAHAMDIKVLLDYVVNHTGYQHEWLNDPEKKDWFHNKGDITNYNDKDQVLNYNLAGLPDLNTENPEVKDYFFNNALWWIRQTGVDGFRLDTVKHVPEDYWNEFAYVIKQEFPDFYLLGEVFQSSASYLATFNEVGLDSVTNFSLYEGIKDTFRVYGDARKLRVAIQNDSKFDNPSMNAIFLDNHDVSRLISRTSKHGNAYLKQGLTFIMTYPSIPVIYYGTEVGLEGKEDPHNRMLMPFDQVDNEIHLYYQELVVLREKIKGYDQVEIIDVTSDYIIIAYAKDNKKLITAFNVSLYDKDVELDGTYKDYLTGDTLSGKITLKSLETLILMEE